MDRAPGYCKREVLAARLGRPPSRVSHIARELEAEGTIKRLGGGVWGKATVYELLPLDASQSAPAAHPIQGASSAHPKSAPRAHPTEEARTHSKSAPATHSQVSPSAHPIPDNPDKPSSSLRRTTRTGRGGRAAASDDDSDSSARPDPRTLLLGLGASPEEADPIIVLIEEATGRPAGEYLMEQIGQRGEEHGRRLVRRARRKLGLPEPMPPWCGDPECDEPTRLRVTETEDGPKARRCPKCHPGAGSGP